MKLWYPVALTVTVASCGGKTDSGDVRPGAGGATHLDTGSPTQTGGMSPVPPYGPLASAGGAMFVSTGSGGANATGGSSSIDTGTPTATGGRAVIIIYGAIGVNGLR